MRLLKALAVGLLLTSSAWGQTYGPPPVPFGATIANFGGLQFAIAPGSISSPSGSMTNYALGDTITLQCTGIVFSVPPVVGVTSVTNSAVVDYAVTNPGITSNSPNTGSVVCSQNTTSGVGAGFTMTASLGLIAANLSMQALATGGASNNSDLFLNIGTNPNDNCFSAFAGSETTFIGNKAGCGIFGNSQQNTCIGATSCGNGGSGFFGGNVTVVGTDAARNIQGSSVTGANTIVGNGAGRNIAGCCNVFMGYQAAGTNGVNNAGNLTGAADTVIGYNAGQALSTGRGDVLIGSLVGSALSSGSNNIIISANNSGSDICANGNESNVVAFCGSIGRVFAITGTGTPATAVTSVSGSMTVNGPITSSNSPTTVTASQVSYSGVTVAASNCGSIAGSVGCIVVNVAGTQHYVPYF